MAKRGRKPKKGKVSYPDPLVGKNVKEENPAEAATPPPADQPDQPDQLTIPGAAAEAENQEVFYDMAIRKLVEVANSDVVVNKPVLWLRVYFTDGKCFRIAAEHIASRLLDELIKIQSPALMAMPSVKLVDCLVRMPSILSLWISKGYIPWATIRHKAFGFERDIVVDVEKEWLSCRKDWN